MRRLFLIVSTLLAIAVSLFAQEPLQDRAKRIRADEIPLLLEKAKAGDHASQVLLWLAYSHGYGVPRDVSKGVPWLRKAAEQGDARAQKTMAQLYGDGGGGLPRDLSQLSTGC